MRSDNPGSVAKTGPIGSLYMRTVSGELYVKTDAGTSTNWKLLTKKSQEIVQACRAARHF